MIGASGIRVLVDSKVDYGKSQNLILTSVIFVTGLSGIRINLGNVKLSGMVLACIVGMLLSLAFYVLEKLHLTNEPADESVDRGDQKREGPGQNGRVLPL